VKRVRDKQLRLCFFNVGWREVEEVAIGAYEYIGWCFDCAMRRL
jgi:hypothetical protein